MSAESNEDTPNESLAELQSEDTGKCQNGAKKCIRLKCLYWSFLVVFLITLALHTVLLCLKWDEHLGMAIPLLIAVIAIPISMLIILAKRICTVSRIREYYRHAEYVRERRDEISESLNDDIEFLINQLLNNNNNNQQLCPEELCEIIEDIFDTKLDLTREAFKVIARSPLKSCGNKCNSGCC